MKKFIFKSSSINAYNLDKSQTFIARNRINSLPNYDKFFDLTKCKEFADNESDVTKLMTSVFNTVENMVGKGECAGFQKGSFLKIVKSQDCVVKSYPFPNDQF